MDGFEAFRKALQAALVHVRDPDCEFAPVLYAATGCSSDEGPGPMQAEILRALGSLKPAPDLPRGSRAWREYEVLYHRFVLGLTVEESADQLYLSRRTLQRTQREAMHVLARQVWGHWQEGGLAAAETEAAAQPAGKAVPGDQGTEWRAQAQQELASLQRGAPDAVTDVGHVIGELLELGRFLTQRPGVSLELGFVQPEMVAGVHSSALRQMLVTAVSRLVAYADGPITMYGGLEDGKAKVTLTAVFDKDRPPSEGELVRDILLPKGASVEATLREDTVFLSLRLPSSGALSILVVDDNPDIVHFYRRSVAGTDYRIVRAEHTGDLFDLVRAITPQAIVLDIMLPDIDGWELLMRLYEDPATRAIPVVVCTVVREEQLALSLGAAAYLAKPVDAQQFVATLDRVTQGS